MQGRLQPDLQDEVGNEPLADVQDTIKLVDALRRRAWERREVLSDSTIYEWMCVARKRAGDSRLGARLEQSCQILYALMNGEVEGRLSF